MAGHSKWHNIKNRKAAVDEKKGQVFSQLSRQIRMAVKEGGSDDPQFNASLRMALDKARAANLPKENIQKSIDRGMGRGEGGALTEAVYEGFGPGGVGMLIVIVTDNPNRTLSEIKNLLGHHQGSLGAPGSAQYLFKRGSDGDYQVVTPIPVSDEKTQAQLQSLVESLREHEDVEDVFVATDSIS